MSYPGPRIAFVTTVYDHTDVGGGTFVSYLRNAIESGALNMTIFSEDIERPSREYERKVFIPSTAKGVPGGFLVRSKYYHNAVQSDHQVMPFDIVWHNNVLTTLSDVRRHPEGDRMPVIGMINDYNNAESRTPLTTRRKFGAYRAAVRHGWRYAEKYLARSVDCLVVNSNYMKTQIAKSYGVDENRIRLLYKGVDLSQFRFAGMRPCKPPVRLLFVKRDFVRGGLLDLIDALRNFPREISLTIVGPPKKYHDSIWSAVRDAALDSVQLLDLVSRECMPDLLSAHDILCVPSRSEALGVAFLEALASGISTVGSTVGGIPEVLDQGRAGWLVRPQDPEHLRATLISAIDDESERKRKVERGLDHVQAFNHVTMLRRMKEIADSVTSNKYHRETCA